MEKMFKMLKLDWSATKSYRIKFLLMGIGLLVIGWSSTVWLVPVGVYLMFSFSVNSFWVEEKGDLNRLYLTLPIKRSQVVTGRYLLAFILFIAGIVLALALMPLCNLFSLSKWYPDARWFLALVSFGFFLHALMSLFMYPVLFKLGYQKGKMWGFYIPSILIGVAYIAVMEYDHIIYGGYLIFDLFIFASEHLLLVAGGMFGLSIIMLAVSCLLSMKIYSGREF